MILAAHQPNHLPWLGYFHKAAQCDLFVHVDHVQFEKQGFQSRTRLKLANGPRWTVVPLARGPQSERIDEKRIVDDGWRERTWATLEHAYARAPFFALYAAPLYAAYARRWDSLVELNLHFIALCFDWLGIAPRTVRSSMLGVTGAKTGMIAELCAAAGADVYLSGAGASRQYLDQGLLAARGVRVEWQEFAHPEYPQRFPALGFAPSLSVLDLLFNCGPRSREILLGIAPEKQAVAHAFVTSQ